MRYGDLSTNRTARETERDIAECFRKWGIDSWRIPLPRKGGQWGSEAIVQFRVGEAEHTLPCDRFPDYRINLRAIYMILDALRKAAERGILEELARAALAMLPAGKAKRPPHEVLHVAPDTPLDVAEAAYKALARRLHPDSGGSHEAMTELNEAWEAFQTTAKEER